MNLLEKSWEKNQNLKSQNSKWIEILPEASSKLLKCLEQINNAIIITKKKISESFETKSNKLEEIRNECGSGPLTAIRFLLPLLSKITRKRKNIQLSDSFRQLLTEFAIQNVYKYKCERLISLVSAFNQQQRNQNSLSISEKYDALKPLLMELDETHCDGWNPIVSFFSSNSKIMFMLFIMIFKTKIGIS